MFGKNTPSVMLFDISQLRQKRVKKEQKDYCGFGAFDFLAGVHWLDDEHHIIKDKGKIKIILNMGSTQAILFEEKDEFAKTPLVHHYNPATRHLAVLCHSQQKVYVYNEKFEQINFFSLEKDTLSDITIALDNDDNLWHN